MKNKVFDVIVIGAGSGLTISSQAASMGLKVAVIEKGPFGGTCLNRGCIPSKVLIHSADVMETIKNSKTFGITSKVTKVNWKKIQKRVWDIIDEDAKAIERGNKHSKNITVYKGETEFVGKKTLKVKNQLIVGKKIFICAGTRPSIPPITGLDKVKYMTSKEALRNPKQPKKLTIIGGGYIATELAHFYSSLGTKVTMLVRGNMLVKREDEEISKRFTKIAPKKYSILFKSDIQNISQKGKIITVNIKHKGKNKKITSDQLLLATGRKPNTDILKVEKTKVKTTKRGYVQVNQYMETNIPGIWAIGDIAGIYLFKHSANLEAKYAAFNAFNPKRKTKVNYKAMPHAIFTSPQIAGVGMTEQQLKEKGVNYAVGRYEYINTGMGMAIDDKEGFVKVLIDPHKGTILGCHIIGHDASSLIHEVIVAMKAGLTARQVLTTVHIHPALSEVVQRAFGNIQHHH